MKVYTTDKIRNVVLLGHGGSGKTSLAEAFAYLSGITSRLGKVTDGNTISDYSKEEQKRQFSINTSVIPIEWEGHKINILDTPGYFDFVGLGIQILYQKCLVNIFSPVFSCLLPFFPFVCVLCLECQSS